MQSKKIGLNDFFSYQSVNGFFIGLGVIVVFLLIFATADPFDNKIKELEFKKFLLYTIVSKPVSYEDKDHEDENAANIKSAVEAGNFIKEETKNGKSIEDILNKEAELSLMLDDVKEENRDKFASFYISAIPDNDKSSMMIIMGLARNGNWRVFRNDKANVALLKDLLKGKGTISEIVYPKLNFTPLFLALISILQLSTFIGYLVGVDNNYHYRDYNVKWYQLNWGKIGTYIIIMLFIPGALVIVIPWFLVKLIVFDFGDLIKKSRKEKLVQKNEAKVIREKSFDPKFLRAKFSENRKESEALLAKLESKCKGGAA